MAKNLASIDVSTLKGVGPAIAKKLQGLGIEYIQDVLFHLPFRYENRTRVTPIGAAQPGESIVLEGEVVACDVAYGRRRPVSAFRKAMDSNTMRSIFARGTTSKVASFRVNRKARQAS